MKKKKTTSPAPKTGPGEPAHPANPPREDPICPVAGIGASAGGMEAFSELLQHLPNDSGMAFVLIQHLDPKHDSLLTELLSKVTNMTVSQVADGMRVSPNCVYVIPPNANMSISQGALRLEARPNHHMPIDHFFRSLADDQGSKAVGVILSGTASDGTLGLKAIKAEGGITFAQDEKTARYDGMPRSAVLAGCVDFILPPAGIARELARLCRHPYVTPPRGDDVPDHEQAYNQVFSMLRNATGVDFLHYKHATIRRRIHRRMALNKLERIDQYAEYLRRNPSDLNALFQDILINVTSFFREPDAFDALKEKIFPALVKGRSVEDPLRFWTPGCATGEEAYSVAICLVEYLHDKDLDIPVQVFGTDLSEISLEKARAGLYPDSIAADVSAERLRRFFVKVNGNYQISRTIRDQCVFARQNLTKDPPFSKLDMISCRNVLIYLGPVLQAKVLRFFHYGLKPGGYLILGNSETVGPATELFAPAGGKEKIYTRKSTPHAMSLDLGTFDDHRVEREFKPLEDWVSNSELQKRVDQLILARHSPPGVVVNEDLKILQFRGHTAPFLEHTSGEPSLNLLKMTRSSVGLELRKLIQKVKKTAAIEMSAPIQLAGGAGVRPVTLSVTPITGAHAGEMAFLVLFEAQEIAEGKPRREEKKKPAVSRLEDLEQELTATKQYLRTVIEEQEASSEELKSAHEEVQSSNEELQSTNEELLTSKEELQSTNEELNTVNEEMQGRNAELTQINNDVNNLLSSVNIPIVMLGSDLRIRRFTPQAEKALNLLATDIGRKVTDFRIKISTPDLEALFVDVIDNLHTKEREVQDQDGRTYLMSIRPYRTVENKIDGAVMTLFDITERKESSEIRYRRLFEAGRDGILLIDAGTAEIIDVNPFLGKLSGYSRSDLMGRRFWETALFRGAGVDGLAHLPEGESIHKTLALRAKNGRQIDTEVVANAYKEGQKLIVQFSIRDVSERLRAEESLRRTDAERRRVEKMEAVGRLAGGLAHDFNNLLTTIVGYSDLLQARIGSDPALQGDLEEIRKAGERATGLARQLMAFGGKQIPQPAIIDMKTELADMAQVLRVLIDDGIQLTVTANAEGHVKADRAEFEQVVTSLVLNARDAMPDGGKIAIETADVGDQVMLSVSDTGAGMDEETQSRLFEPFFTTKSRGLGAGLGLSTTYAIVKRIGGNMRVSTELDRGTTFQIYLPRVQGESQDPTPREATGGSETIMLVEDEPLVRRLSSTVLREKGYRVLEAAGGPEALRIAREHDGDIQLLIVDVVMPRMSGREVADRLTSQRPGMKILFTTGDAKDAIEHHGVMDDGFVLLQKPFTPKALAWKVREVLDVR